MIQTIVKAARCLLTVVALGATGPAFGAGSGFVADSVLHVKGGVERIGDREYEGRDDFHSVVFEAPVRMRVLGKSAFSGCSRLRSVALPATLEDVGAHSFAYCGALREVTFGPKLLHVGSNAFSRCVSLERVALPASVKELESYAFSDCESLRDATLPANGHLLGELIFSGCRSLEVIRELSGKVPAFDCGSTLFDPPFGPESWNPYEQCELEVGAGMEEAYRRAEGWRLFARIRSQAAGSGGEER